jgi:hypothetical protein
VVDGLIQRSQYLGLAVDGATLHCNVGMKLVEHFDKMVHDAYDPLHKAGLVQRAQAQAQAGKVLVRQ